MTTELPPDPPRIPGEDDVPLAEELLAIHDLARDDALRAEEDKNELRPLVLFLSRESLRTRPPPRDYLLKDANTGDGRFLRGTVGLLAAEGGAGKSYALAQLCVSLSTGLTWFGNGGWAPQGDPLRVLYLAGEEDKAELTRRIYYAAKAMGAISDEALDLIARNLHAVPLAGNGCSLTVGNDPKSDGLPMTLFAWQVFDLMRIAKDRTRPYGALIIDPLSRFAGFDVEKDNSAATRFVQVLERFTGEDTGMPSCICAHHMKKRGEGSEEATADAIRGASALKDGVRWAALLEPQKRQDGAADLLTLRIVKANGVPPSDPLFLCRPGDGNEGVLRVATRDEISSHDVTAKAQNKSDELIEKKIEQVITFISTTNHAMTGNQLAAKCGNRKATLAAIKMLKEAKRVVEAASGGLVLGPVPGGSGRFREPEGDGGELVPQVSPPRDLLGGNLGTRHPGGSGTDKPVPGSRNQEGEA